MARLLVIWMIERLLLGIKEVDQADVFNVATVAFLINDAKAKTKTIRHIFNSKDSVFKIKAVGCLTAVIGVAQGVYRIEHFGALEFAGVEVGGDFERSVVAVEYVDHGVIP